MKNIALVVLLACSLAITADKPASKAAAQLRQAELDFAKAFADRDVGRFASFVAENARFNGGGKLTQGKAAVVESWTEMMKNTDLTLTWEPDVVETSAAGDLGYTNGPYVLTLKKPDGTTVTQRGRFASVWRRGKDGKYRVELDSGSPER